MKIEPIKKAKLPKYAAALAVIASAALLTGCGNTEPALDGTAPADIVEQTVPADSSEDDSLIRLEGEVSDDSIEEETVLAGVIDVITDESSEMEVELAGDVDEVALEGDVAVTDTEDSRVPEIGGLVATPQQMPNISKRT